MYQQKYYLGTNIQHYYMYPNGLINKIEVDIQTFKQPAFYKMQQK